MKLYSGLNRVTLLFCFFISSFFTAGSTHLAFADEVEDYLNAKSLEFSAVHENIYRDFVQFVFQQNCPEQMEKAETWLKAAGRKKASIQDKWVNYLEARNETFLWLFRECAKLDSALDLTDRFKTSVPNYFSSETLILAKVKLLSDDDPDTFKERVLEADRLIQSDIDSDYTVEKLYRRLELKSRPVVPMWDEFELEIPAQRTDESQKELSTVTTHRCFAVGCEVKLSQTESILSQCTHCVGLFCRRHRLLEDHRCEKLSEVKSEQRKRLAESNPVVLADKLTDRI